MNQLLINQVDQKIHVLRGIPVILDFDLSALYDVETKYLKRLVRRPSIFNQWLLQRME